MLNKAIMAIRPSKFHNELAALETELDALNVRRDELRIKISRAVDMHNRSASSFPRYQLDALLREQNEVQSRIDELRARRREINDVIAEARPSRSRIPSVSMPPELIALQEKLDEAREDRRRILDRMNGPVLSEGLHAAYEALNEAEDRITNLRKRRAEMSEPYYAAMGDAMRPVVLAAADALLRAALEAKEAIATIREASSMLPPSSKGHGLGPIMDIVGVQSWDDAERFAKQIGGKPSEHREAAE